MPNDELSQRLIKYLQKLSYSSYMLTKDVDRTADFIIENGLDEDLTSEAISVIQFTNSTQRAFDGVIIAKKKLTMNPLCKLNRWFSFRPRTAKLRIQNTHRASA